MIFKVEPTSLSRFASVSLFGKEVGKDFQKRAGGLISRGADTRIRAASLRFPNNSAGRASDIE
jgi:hypothetical protein